MMPNICVLVTVKDDINFTHYHFPVVLDPNIVRFQVDAALKDIDNYEGIWLSNLPSDYQVCRLISVEEIEMPVVVTE